MNKRLPVLVVILFTSGAVLFALLFAVDLAASAVDQTQIPPGVQTNAGGAFAGELSVTTLLTWTYECADCPPNIESISDRHLHLDAADQPHVVFGADQVYYAYRDASTWHIQAIQPGLYGTGWPALDLDSGGYPHVAFIDHANSAVKYARLPGSTWQVEIVEGNLGDESNGTSLVLDGSGYPHIGYFDSTGQALKFAFLDGSGWHTATIDSGLGAYGGYPSLALDGDGYAHISYIDYANSALKYAYQDASGWHVQLLDDMGEGWSKSSIAVDNNGYVHIAYYFTTEGDLKYARQSISGWEITTVDPFGPLTGYYPSIALDDSDEAHISYAVSCGGPCADLRYAYHDIMGWHTATLEGPADEGWYSSLALDSQDRPHITYYAGTGYNWAMDGDLKYAHREPTGWQFEIVQRGGSVGQYNSLALDSFDNPHISYYDNVYADLKYANRSGGIWYTQTVDSAGMVGTYNSLAVNEDQYAHISYIDQTNTELMYAYQDASGWQTETVDTDAWYGDTSIALDGTGDPRISYADTTSLRYAYKDAGGWHAGAVPGVAGPCNAAMVLDTQDNPHISAACSGGLFYGYKDLSGWHFEMILDGYFAGRANSLALDLSGYPHISYQDRYDQSLYYAWRDALGWNFTSIDASGQTGYDNSLALDNQGYAHISYSGEYDLRYAYQDESGWHLLSIDERMHTGAYNSLAMDHNGSPHIAYSNQRYYDLRYVTKATPQAPSTAHLAGPSSGYVGEAELFTATVQPLTTSLPVAYQWEATDQLTVIHNDGLTDTVGFTWATPGTKVVKVTAGNLGGTVVATQTLSIADRPIAGLAASNNSPTWLGRSTTFSAVILTGSNVSYTWDFGDHGQGVGATVTYLYPELGSYTATVTATNSVSTLTDTTRVVITEMPISGLIMAHDSPTVLGDETAFTATISMGSHVSYTWALGDGEHGVGAQLSHLYQHPGVYTAVVTATNGAGSVSADDVIWVEVPVGGLQAYCDSPTRLGATTHFTATIAAGSNVNLTWDFGDGEQGNGEVTSHTYEALGVYTATVTANNHVGQSSTTTVVTVIEPMYHIYLPVALHAWADPDLFFPGR